MNQEDSRVEVGGRSLLFPHPARQSTVAGLSTLYYYQWHRGIVGVGMKKVDSEQSQLNWIADFIWDIADDVLRDLYVRGKYRDVILSMTVLRRLSLRDLVR